MASSPIELIPKLSKLLVNIYHKLLEQFLCLNGIKTYRAIFSVTSLMSVLVSQCCDLTCLWIHLPGQISDIDISLSLVFSLSHTCPQTLSYDTYKGTAVSASSSFVHHFWHVQPGAGLTLSLGIDYLGTDRGNLDCQQLCHCENLY